MRQYFTGVLFGFNPRWFVSAKLVLRLMESQTIFIIDIACFYPAPKALLKLPMVEKKVKKTVKQYDLP